MSHPKRVQKIERLAEKKAIEVARYVLPVAAFTTMVHTLSGIVLHRLWRMVSAGDTPYEARLVVGEMVQRVKEVDPGFFDRFENKPLAEEEIPEWRWGPKPGDNTRQGGMAEFDRQLGGRVSRLMDYSPQAGRVVAQALRAVLGLSGAECTDEQALDLLMNPALNHYRLETLNVGVHSPMMRALQHAHYTFFKKISHTADSQDQRHRMVPASRPMLVLADTREPDFITPMLIQCNLQVRERFEQAVSEAWAAKNQLLDMGISPEFALYLLPNAKAIRLVESGSLLHLLHKWTMRTCFNAQEEIYFASMDELDQIRAVHPEIAQWIGPPCYIRAGITTPICTEGSHFCGIKVWETFPKIQRLI
jgi:thymidylate synthase ThyX